MHSNRLLLASLAALSILGGVNASADPVMLAEYPHDFSWGSATAASAEALFLFLFAREDGAHAEATLDFVNRCYRSPRPFALEGLTGLGRRALDTAYAAYLRAAPTAQLERWWEETHRRLR